ncbi:Qat anti-phage system associated protein QatB [Mesorhizobium sp. M2D.F.Ca.ET.232.01.1.1]
MGGAGAAARVMAPSRRVASGLGQLANDVGTQGAAEALRPFNLESLAGSPASQVLTALTDVLCPDGGPIDEAIARSAMLETAAELAASGDVPFDALPPPALEAIFLGTIARSITAKLFNELAGGAVKLSSDTATLRSVENTLRDYIQGKVSDVFAAAGRTLASIPRAQIDGFVKTIYEGAFALLEAFGE